MWYIAILQFVEKAQQNYNSIRQKMNEKLAGCKKKN